MSQPASSPVECLRDFCLTNQIAKGDSFVGVRVRKQNIEVIFPTGFTLSQDNVDVRRDILSLLSAIESYSSNDGSRFLATEQHHRDAENMPLSSHFELINHFIADPRLFIPTTTSLSRSGRGRVDWQRTIRLIPRLLSSNGVPVHHEFVTRQTTLDADSLITQIHHYCLWISFNLFGWLFTSFVPSKPVISFDRFRFLRCIQSHLDSTFNDQAKRILLCLRAVVLTYDENLRQGDFEFGTYRFEYVWEGMIDSIFGVAGKDKYFPRTSWRIHGKDSYQPARLKPDTIMVHDESVYVLDAKYYRYGLTRVVNDLPGSSDVSKQVVYGQHAASIVTSKDVYNGFLLPGAVEGDAIVNAENIGMVFPEWVENPRSFEVVQGIIVDTKSLLHLNRAPNSRVKSLLAESFVPVHSCSE